MPAISLLSPVPESAASATSPFNLISERPPAIQIERRRHPGPVLRPVSSGAPADVWTIRVIEDFGYSGELSLALEQSKEGEGEPIVLYCDAADRLEKELDSQREPLRAVQINPWVDSFPASEAIQAEVGRVVERLAARGIDCHLMTRGMIHPKIERLLASCRRHVKLTCRFTTLDRSMQSVLEPLAASARLRLHQLGRLLDLGVQVHVALDPLVPGLTDTRASLQPLLEAVAKTGVREVTVGYVVLRSDTRESFLRALEPHGWHDVVLDAFADGCQLKVGAGASVWSLSKSRRQRGYATVMALAAGLGMTVRIHGVTNPDFGPKAEPPASAPRQRLLPGIQCMNWPTDRVDRRLGA